MKAMKTPKTMSWTGPSTKKSKVSAFFKSLFYPLFFQKYIRSRQVSH
jgi:hypothetical protein